MPTGGKGFALCKRVAPAYLQWLYGTAVWGVGMPLFLIWIVLMCLQEQATLSSFAGHGELHAMALANFGVAAVSHDTTAKRVSAVGAVDFIRKIGQIMAVGTAVIWAVLVSQQLKDPAFVADSWYLWTGVWTLAASLVLGSAIVILEEA